MNPPQTNPDVEAVEWKRDYSPYRKALAKAMAVMTEFLTSEGAPSTKALAIIAARNDVDTEVASLLAAKEKEAYKRGYIDAGIHLARRDLLTKEKGE